MYFRRFISSIAAAVLVFAALAVSPPAHAKSRAKLASKVLRGLKRAPKGSTVTRARRSGLPMSDVSLRHKRGRTVYRFSDVGDKLTPMETFVIYKNSTIHWRSGGLQLIVKNRRNASGEIVVEAFPFRSNEPAVFTGTYDPATGALDVSGMGASVTTTVKQGLEPGIELFDAVFEASR
jgi:hypothetical protein